MEYRVNYDSQTGDVLGVYDNTGEVIYPKGIPEPSIEISAEERDAAYEKIAKVIDGKFVLEEIPSPTIDDMKTEWRNRANSDFVKRKALYLNNIAYADAMGRDSSVLKAALQREEALFKDRILKINQGVNPYTAK